MLSLRYDDVVTSRLSLVAITPAMLLSEQAGNGRLGELTGCAVAANWPPEHWEPHVFELLLRHYEQYPEQVNRHRYVARIRKDEAPLLIGTIGAFWREERPAECEIGWSVLPPHQGQGLATEAARSLLALIRKDARIANVVAHTFPELAGSVRVMEKCGMRFDGAGEEAGTVRYRLQLRE